MIDTGTVGTPGWWMHKLYDELQKRIPRYELLDSYYRGDPPLPWGPSSMREAYQAFQRKGRMNWSRMIVEAVRERQMVTGFRQGSAGTTETDSRAWDIWQSNHLDADQALLHRSKLTMGDAYVIVGPPHAAGLPTISVEDPRQVITAPVPGDRRRAGAGLKVFTDDWGARSWAYLYLPGAVYTASRKVAEGAPLTTFDPSTWEEYSAGPIPQGQCPVVRFRNRADTFGRSLGEFEDVIDDIDRINIVVLQRMTITVLQAFKQRAIKGLPKSGPDGKDIDYSGDFLSGPGELWNLPDKAEMWESGAVDLSPILESIKSDVRDLAAQTSTPMYRLTPDAAAGSAEGASLQREGLVFKTNDRNTETGEEWEQVMGLATLFATGQPAAPDTEVIWSPPERFSLAERYDAAVKAQSAGVPWNTVMADVLQFSPQQIDRMAAERATDLLQTAQLTQLVPAGVG